MPTAYELLTPDQQRCAVSIVRHLYYSPIAVPRIERIFRVTASAKPLIDLGTLRFSGLSRRERKIAASVVWVAYTALDDDTLAEQLLTFLGTDFAVTYVLNVTRKAPLRAVAS
jgi:hypothetical protein